jgi:peptide deformylase
MPLPKVLLHPDSRLKQVAAPAPPEEAEQVGAGLLDTMDELGHCVGLAAP